MAKKEEKAHIKSYCVHVKPSSPANSASAVLVLMNLSVT
jgi:hypothetical protein